MHVLVMLCKLFPVHIQKHIQSLMTTTHSYAHTHTCLFLDMPRHAHRICIQTYVYTHILVNMYMYTYTVTQSRAQDKSRQAHRHIQACTQVHAYSHGATMFSIFSLLSPFASSSFASSSFPSPPRLQRRSHLSLPRKGMQQQRSIQAIRRRRSS